MLLLFYKVEIFIYIISWRSHALTCPNMPSDLLLRFFLKEFETYNTESICTIIKCHKICNLRARRIKTVVRYYLSQISQIDTYSCKEEVYHLQHALYFFLFNKFYNTTLAFTLPRTPMFLKGASVALVKVKNINTKTCFPTAHSPQHCFLSVLFIWLLLNFFIKESLDKLSLKNDCTI